MPIQFWGKPVNKIFRGEKKKNTKTKCINVSEVIQKISMENKIKREIILSLSDQRKFHQIKRESELDPAEHTVCVW